MTGGHTKHFSFSRSKFLFPASVDVAPKKKKEKREKTGKVAAGMNVVKFGKNVVKRE
ncbi:hypothetical protein Phum_PHUM511890 [Pediculus humanus corporis]|uniref:Uncharacterized protein n=1 Tax=Pediculus humanus subsp. corporis TaxID=121224 RepID=E0VY90_PEDHC|nr:uncharacterized protein Phum_PHUM511890 [Pediculus humanus corporis]EEB18346.1 hypothetical protein Phum_PHUM511890 [Pediculus humanus corporis]